MTLYNLPFFASLNPFLHLEGMAMTRSLRSSYIFDEARVMGKIRKGIYDLLLPSDKKRYGEPLNFSKEKIRWGIFLIAIIIASIYGSLYWINIALKYVR